MKEEKRKCGFIHVIQYEGVTKDGQKYHQFETHAEGSHQLMIDCMCNIISYMADSGADSVGDILGEMLIRCAYLKAKELNGDAFRENESRTHMRLDPKTVDMIKEILKKKGEKEENGSVEE